MPNSLLKTGGTFRNHYRLDLRSPINPKTGLNDEKITLTGSKENFAIQPQRHLYHCY
jgi:hypothetical protein